MRTYNVVVELDESGHWIAGVPAIPGCHTHGDSLSKSGLESAKLGLFVSDAMNANLVEKLRTGAGGLGQASRHRR